MQKLSKKVMCTVESAGCIVMGNEVTEAAGGTAQSVLQVL